MGKISVIINTLNEECNIKDCIESVKSIADEIVVCDMYSEDRTAEIAKENGAVVAYIKKMRHVGPARYSAISNASCEWVLLFDADERMTGKLAAKLKEIAEEDKVDVVCVGILYNYFGKVIKHGGFFSNNFPRFFRKKIYFETYDKRDEDPHHDGYNMMEKVKNRIKLPRTYFIEHYPYPSVNSYIDKTIGWYAIIEAETMFNNGERFKLYKLIFQPPKTFIAAYILRAGFLDGIEGFILAVFYSAFRFAVWANLWWLEKGLKTGRII